MPILKRTSFTNKRDVRSSLKYLFYGQHKHLNQPKHPNNSGVRNLVVDGYGLNPTSYLTAYNSMRYYFSHNNGKRGLLNLVMSFPKDDFPPHAFSHINSSWALIVDELAKKFAISAFGHDHQFITCVQDDGINHNAHAHIFVNLVSTSAKTKSGSFRSMSGRVYNFPRLSRIASAVTSKFNREHGTCLTVDPRSKPLTRSQSHVYKSVHRVINDFSINTVGGFKRELNKYGVRPDFNRKHGKIIGLSFDYFPRSHVLSGYSNHVKSSTLVKKTNDPSLRFDSLLRRFNSSQPLFNYQRRCLRRKFAKLLNRSHANSSRYVNQLRQVVKLSPDEDQRKQASCKIKAVKLHHVIGKSSKSNDQDPHNNLVHLRHHPQSPSL